MAKQQDKKRELQQRTPPSTTLKSTTDSSTTKDPDLYDPVGMAGKKAGVVTEIEQELKAPTKRNDKDAAGKGG